MPSLPSPDFKPLTDMATEVIDKGTDLANTLIGIGKLDATTIENIEKYLDQILGKIDSHAISILDKVKEVYTAAPQLLPDNPPKVDPALTLTKIAEAINETEAILNKQNLVITTGNVEVELYVLTIPKGESAHAKISFKITPKPQN